MGNSKKDRVKFLIDKGFSDEEIIKELGDYAKNDKAKRYIKKIAHEYRENKEREEKNLNLQVLAERYARAKLETKMAIEIEIKKRLGEIETDALLKSYASMNKD